MNVGCFPAFQDWPRGAPGLGFTSVRRTREATELAEPGQESGSKWSWVVRGSCGIGGEGRGRQERVQGSAGVASLACPGWSWE